MKQLLLAVAALFWLTACNNEGEGTASGADTATTTTQANSEEAKEERNKETALASLRAFEQGNAEEVLKNVATDAVEYGDGSMPEVKGRDSIMSGMKAWFAATSDRKAEVLQAFADGDYVAVYGEFSGKWTGDYMGMKATGKSFKVKDVDIFKFNDEGKIVEHRSVQSPAVMANQIGMKMPDQ
ncbi:MAG TPA: ester cyclase [Chitinophagaceae bacterium]